MSQKVEKSSLTGLRVKVSKHGSPRIAQLLQNTVFGTEGKLRYRQKEIADRIKSQSNVQFIEILKGNRVFGTAGMTNRNVLHGDDYMQTLYVRYLSFAHAFKSKNSTNFSTLKRKGKNRSVLREMVLDEISAHFEQPFIEADKQGLFYAFVESANINSRNLCLSMGFEAARKVETLLFSRFNPTQQKSISNIAEYEQDEVKKKLSEFYKDYSFYFEDQIFRTGFYLVKKENGKIIGGIRAIPVNWQLVEYPGFEGWLMQDILPYLPFTNRLFQPGSFKFLAFDYAWHAPNLEHIIPELMAHCCSLFGINMGMIWGDTNSELIKNLKSSNELGFVHSVSGSVYADLMIRPINFIKMDGGFENFEENTNVESKVEIPNKQGSIKKSKKENPDTPTSNTEEGESVPESIDAKSNTDNGKSESIQRDEFASLKDVLKKPIFVSALDMT